MVSTVTIKEIPDVINEVKQKLGDNHKLSLMFDKCYRSTYETTLKYVDDGTVFIITGDIPAMWLRDSSCQVKHYLPLTSKSKEMADIIEKLIKRQFMYINIDPYANAFNINGNGNGHQDDETDMMPWIWERKYEIDSLCYPIQLSYLFWKNSGTTQHFKEDSFKQGIERIITLWKTEQDHINDSSYRFTRLGCVQSDTLPENGLGNKVKKCGLTWSGFRPSDDACIYGYLIPSNMFAVVVLGYIEEIAEIVLGDSTLVEKARNLKNEINDAIQKYGIYNHEKYGKIYAYETDGYGNYNLMDDANVPSLLSIPYLGYTTADDEIYQNTRRFILSESNKYFFCGKVAKGIGSPHTPENYIWHIALSMQGLTSVCEEEKATLLELLLTTDADTLCMHEGFHVDDPTRFTRPWFAWANSLFSEFVLDYTRER